MILSSDFRWLLVLLAVLSSLAVSSPSVVAQTQECPAVNCDCRALVKSDWVELCLKSEQVVKNACIANGGKPNKYCGLHGPSASPIALQSVFPPYELERDSDLLDGMKRRVVIMLWSVRNDMDIVKEKLEEQSYKEAFQILTLIEANIDRVFKTQRQLTGSWGAYGEDKKVRDAWRGYAEELDEIVVLFDEYSAVLWNRYQDASDDAEKKATRILSFRVMRAVGELIEQEAFAIGALKRNSTSAKRWRAAALNAEQLEQREKLTTNNIKRAMYYRYQAAARWNRASYHWLAAKNEKFSLSDHNQARALLGLPSIALDKERSQQNERIAPAETAELTETAEVTDTSDQIELLDQSASLEQKNDGGNGEEPSELAGEQLLEADAANTGEPERENQAKPVYNPPKIKRIKK